MGKFQSGIWLILLLFYMFIHFIVVYGINTATIDYDINTSSFSANDIGFGAQINTPCIGNIETYCFNTEKAYFEAGCELIDGCSWENSSFCIDNGCCNGLVNYTSCSEVNNSEECKASGCKWDTDDEEGNIVDPNKARSSATVSETFGIMFGFAPTVNLPSKWYFIYSFFFTWIPSLMLLFSLYMILPFIH